MTNKGPSGATPWVDGDVLQADDLLDTFGEVKWKSQINVPVFTTSFKAVIAHSSSVFSALMTNGAMYLSADTGKTWTSKSTILDTASFMRMCRADTTHAVAIEEGTTAEVIFTDDSGTTWTAKTSASFGTTIDDVAFTTAGLIVIAGNDAGGVKHIIYSTDDGGSWTDPTTAPNARVNAVDMFDADVGYAIDDSQKIWKTTDGCDVWLDTGHTVTANNSDTSIICLTATTCLIARDIGIVELYDNTSGTVTKKLVGGGSDNVVLGFAKSGSNYYVSFCGDTTNNATVYKTTDSGVTWSRLSFPPVQTFSPGDTGKCSITPLTAGFILVFEPYMAIKIYDGD